MKCKRCKSDHSWHEWNQKPYCSPFCAGNFKEIMEVAGAWTRATKTEIIGHESDIEQPLRKDGTINPRFVAAHGTKSIEKNLKIDKKTILENVEKYG